MPSQPFGTWTPTPGLMVDGVEYSMALVYGPHLTNRSPRADVIVEGTAEAVASGSANVWDVTCERGEQLSSYTTGDPGDRREEEYSCLSGGNIAATHERQRFISWNNPMYYRGADRGQRAEVGDVLAVTVDGVTRYGLVIEAEPYDVAPAHVAWQGGAGPGRPPRTYNQTNLGTMSGVDGVATTDVDENAGNWHDRLRVRMENGDTIPEGADFQILRGPFADPRTPPVLQIDVKNGGGDWVTVSTGNYLAWWVEGLVLVKKSYLDGLSLPTNARVCFRVAGSIFRQRGTPAEDYNLAAAALNATDEAWTPVANGGTSDAISGQIQTQGIVAQSFECDGGNAYMATAMIGTTRESWFALSELMQAEGATWPFFHRGDLGDTMWRNVFGENPISFTNATQNVAHSCGSSSWNQKDLGTTAREVIIWPFQGDSLGYNHAGAPVSADVDATLAVQPSTFSFQGMAFDATATEFVRNCPVGTVCVKAWLQVKFTDLEVCTWSLSTYNQAPAGGGGAYHIINSYSWNGVPVARYEYLDGVTVENTDNSGTVPQYLDSGPVGFILMGKRVDSTDIFCPITSNPTGIPDDYGITVEAPADQWQSFGAGVIVGGTAEDGQWAQVDVTNCINAALRNRDSTYTGLQLWPSCAGADPGDTAEDMAGVAAGYAINQAVTFEVTHPGGTRWHATTYTASGSHLRWSGIEFSTILAQFRYPSGVLETRPLPLAQPPLVSSLD